MLCQWCINAVMLLSVGILFLKWIVGSTVLYVNLFEKRPKSWVYSFHGTLYYPARYIAMIHIMPPGLWTLLICVCLSIWADSDFSFCHHFIRDSWCHLCSCNWTMTRDWQLFGVFVKTRLHEAKEKTDAPIDIPVFLESRDAFWVFLIVQEDLRCDLQWSSQSFVFFDKKPPRHARRNCAWTTRIFIRGLDNL